MQLEIAAPRVARRATPLAAAGHASIRATAPIGMQVFMSPPWICRAVGETTRAPAGRVNDRPSLDGGGLGGR